MINPLLFITDSLYKGTLISVPFLFVVHLLKTSIPKIHLLILMQAVNCSLLLGSLLYIAWSITTISIAFFSGSEYGQFTLMNRAFGPFWFVLWLFIISRLLLPQLLWFKKLQTSIKISAMIWAIWMLAILIEKISYIYVRQQTSWAIFYPIISINQYLAQATIYIAIVAAIYWILLILKPKAGFVNH